MRKRSLYLILLVVWLAALAALLVAVLIEMYEPRYGGKALSEWVQDYGKVRLREGDVSEQEQEERVRNLLSQGRPEAALGNIKIVEKIDVPDDPELDARALQAILHIGTNAIPDLLSWIGYKDKDSWVDTKLTNVVYTHYGSRFADGQVVRAVGAMRALSALREKAAAAVPDLALLMNDAAAPGRARRATIALQNLKLDLLTAGAALITNNSPQVRLDAIQVVASSGTAIRPALPALIQSLRDTNEEVAATAAQVLGRAGLEANLVVPALTNILNDKRFVVRKAALEALSRFHLQALPAIPALLPLLKDPDPRVRNFAADAIEGIDPQALERATRE